MRKAATATQRIDESFSHVVQFDVQAMPDEEGQFVQLIINTSAGQSEMQRMQAMFKTEFEKA